MADVSVTERVHALVEPLLAAHGVEVVDVEQLGATLRVTVDRPGGIDLDAVSEATLVVSDALDRHDPIPGRYTLEIDFLEAATGAKKRVTMPDGGVLDLTVPEGVADGQTLRLKGKGSPGLRGTEAGDALVEIRVRPHAHFKRAGNDIALDLPITIDEAVLGAKIEVPTVSGRVQLTIPKGTSSGRVFRLKGKGVRNTTSGHTGDQLVTVRIVLPDTIDEKLAYFMSEWRQSHRYDPGRS